MRTIDKTKKSNIKCEHCEWFVEGRDYWNRCKAFTWKENVHESVVSSGPETDIMATPTFDDSTVDVIVKVSKKQYESLKQGNYHSLYDGEDIYKMITSGILISENMTNGDVIKALFPNVHCNETCNEVLVWTDLDGETTRF